MDGERRQRSPSGAQSGGFYGLGLVGAMVWYWKWAKGPREHAIGVLKALVWPAYLVYDAFRGLNRSCGPDGAAGACLQAPS